MLVVLFRGGWRWGAPLKILLGSRPFKCTFRIIVCSSQNQRVGRNLWVLQHSILPTPLHIPSAGSWNKGSVCFEGFHPGLLHWKMKGLAQSCPLSVLNGQKVASSPKEDVIASSPPLPYLQPQTAWGRRAFAFLFNSKSTETTLRPCQEVRPLIPNCI